MIFMWTKSKLTKYFEGRLQPVEDCLLELPLVQIKSEGKHRNWKLYYGTTIHAFG
jgi:hypothetical protein